MDHYLGVAKELGISGGEIGAVQASVMAVAAGKVSAQLREARRTQIPKDPAAAEAAGPSGVPPRPVPPVQTRIERGVGHLLHAGRQLAGTLSAIILRPKCVRLDGAERDSSGCGVKSCQLRLIRLLRLRITLGGMRLNA